MIPISKYRKYLSLGLNKMYGCGGGKFELETEEEEQDRVTREYHQLKREGRL